MSKLAVFVEGFTERLLVELLVSEVAGRHNVRIRVEKASEKLPRRITVVSEDPDIGQLGYVLIRDCGADNSVASDVRDQYASLVSNGYIEIIGLRDLYPKSLEDMAVLLGVSKRSLNFGLRTKPIQVKWIIAVMETEAWFLSEHTHFERVHPAITTARIRQELGFDPRTDDMEARPHPTADLHAAYQLEGRSYRKTRTSISRTIEALDIHMLYLGLGSVQQLQLLINAIDSFVAGICAS